MFRSNLITNHLRERDNARKIYEISWEYLTYTSIISHVCRLWHPPAVLHIISLKLKLSRSACESSITSASPRLASLPLVRPWSSCVHFYLRDQQGDLFLTLRGTRCLVMLTLLMPSRLASRYWFWLFAAKVYSRISSAISRGYWHNGLIRTRVYFIVV